VLLVDDDEPLRTAVRLMLEEQGFFVVGEAAEPSRALDLARERRPDVALVDFRLYGSDGIALANSLKEEAPTLRVIMFTAFGENALAADAARAGITDILVKGCPPQLIAETIRMAAGRSR